MNKTDVGNKETMNAITGDLFAATQAGLASAMPQTAAELELLATRKKAPAKLRKNADEDQAAATVSFDELAAADESLDALPFAASAQTEEPLRFAQTGTGTRTDAGPDTPAADPSASPAAAAAGGNTALLLGGGALLLAAAAGGGGGGGGGDSSPPPADTTAPTITGAAVVATGAQNNTLNAGDTITGTLTFSEVVIVTGTPLGTLNIGGTLVQASYVSGSGTNTLTFSYTVLAGQTDADGISFPANAVSLNGGTIKDAAGNNAVLTHDAGTIVPPIMVDTTSPTISVDAPDNTNDTTPTITGSTNAPDGSTVTVTITQGSSVQTLTATVASGDYSATPTTALADGTYTAAVSVADAAGNLGTNSDNGSVDTSAPTIAVSAPDNTNDSTPTITGTTDAPVGRTVTVVVTDHANAVQTLTTTVQSDGTFSVTPPTALAEGAYTAQASVTGTTGSTGSDTDTGSVDTQAATPTLTLATDSGSSNSDGITNVGTLNVGGLESGATWEYRIDGGTWTAGTATSLTATSGSHTYSVRQTDTAANTSTASAPITVNLDANAPTVSTVAITSATGAQANTLNVGDVVHTTVTMSEATTVTGTPQLALNIGGTTVQANYVSGNGTTALVFDYPIAPNQTDANGISIAANSLALNSGTLRDTAGNNVNLAHSLVADNGSYMVDTTAPTATVTTATISSAANATVQSTETGTAYLVSTGVTVSNLASITGALDNQWNQVAIATANTNTSLAATGLANGDYKLYTVDAAGNLSGASTGTVTIATDTTPPAFGGSGSASVVENFPVQTMVAGNTAASTYWTLDPRVYDPSADGNVGVTYSIVGGPDAALFKVTEPMVDGNNPLVVLSPSGIGLVAPLGFNNNSVNGEGAGTDNTYNFTVRATDASGNFAEQAVTLTITDDGRAQALEVIDLGADDGQLIMPFQVGSNWYYFWERDADGNIRGNDSTDHTTLDGIFTLNAAGSAVGDTTPGATDDTYRYARLNDQNVALPTDAELVAIWDQFGAAMPGYPAYDYWSATPGGTLGRYQVVNLSGTGAHYADGAATGDFVILQYVGPVV